MDKTANITPSKQQYYQAVGRRREASAQVRLYPLPERKTIVVHGQNLKAGDFIVNKKDVAQYFPGEINIPLYSLNKSLKNGSIIMRSVAGREGDTYYDIEGLDDYIDKRTDELARAQGY